MLLSSSPGIKTWTKNQSIIDYSNINEGYVGAKHAGDVNRKHQLRVIKDGTHQNFTIIPDGKFHYYPLCYGNGSYEILLLQSRLDNQKKADIVIQMKESVMLRDQKLPWLYPNTYASYTKDSLCVSTAQKICPQLINDSDKVGIVYHWVMDNVEYDTVLAQTVNTKSWWLPDPDEVITEGKSICFGYSSLVAAMLRSQGVPCKVCVGRVGVSGLLHAWNQVWSRDHAVIDGLPIKENDWSTLDSTFMDTVRGNHTINWVLDDRKYSMEYCG